MDAVKFLEELKRLCESKQRCTDCPLSRDTNNDCPLGYPYGWKGENTKKAISIVEKWSAEHPMKTRLMDFLEKFPNASLGSSGTPLYLPRPFGYCGRETCQGCDHWGSSDCWILPVEE